MRTDHLIALLAEDGDRPPPPPRRVLGRALPLAAVALLLALLLLGVREDLVTAAVPTALKLLLGLVLALAAGRAALLLARPEAEGAVAIRSLWPVPIAFAGILAMQGLWPAAPPVAASFSLLSVLQCLLLVPLLALAPGLALGLALRQGAPNRPGLAGAMAGLAAAGLAILAYGLHCTEDGPLFVALWYVAAAGIAAGIGAWLGRRQLAW